MPCPIDSPVVAGSRRSGLRYRPLAVIPFVHIRRTFGAVQDVVHAPDLDTKVPVNPMSSPAILARKIAASFDLGEQSCRMLPAG